MLQLLLSCVLLAIAYVGARAMMLAQEEIEGINEPRSRR
jgi:hypothetical protein